MVQTSRRRFLSQLASGQSQGTSPGSRPRRSLKDLRQALRGVHSYLPTPFHANLEINPEGMRQNAAFYARAGVQPLSLVVAAGLGELFSLGFEEHREVVSAAAAGAEGRLPVVAGVRGGYRFALRMARNAEEAGADAILVFPPPGGPQTLEGQRRYFTEIARSVGIGVLIYPRTQRDDWSRLLEELADLPNVLGFKDGSGGIALGQSLGPRTRERLVWTARGEEHALRALPAGATAYATSFASLAPKACHEFFRRGIRGDAKGMETPLQGAHCAPGRHPPPASPARPLAGLRGCRHQGGAAGPGTDRRQRAPAQASGRRNGGDRRDCGQVLGVDGIMMESKRRQFLRTVGLLAGGTLAASAGCSPTPGPRRSMEELTRACRGVHNFLTTPFLPDGALDVEGLRGNVAYHADRHPRDMTMVVTCNLGELFSLDLEEHQAAGGRRWRGPRERCRSSREWRAAIN